MFKLPNYTQQPATHNPTQRGFAPILLVVLALVGITAATLLIQSRTNFLPKADDEVIRIKYSYSCDAPGGKRTLSVIQGSTSLYQSDSVNCNDEFSSSRPCSDFSKTFCGDRNMQCERDTDYDAHCIPRKITATNFFRCDLAQVKSNSLSSCPAEQKLLISHCNGGNAVVIGHEDCLGYQGLPANTTYYCYWDKQCSGGQQSPTGPTAAAAPAGQANGISATACSEDQKNLCQSESWQPKGGCVITTTGLRQCKYEGDREGKVCNNDPAHPETGAACGSKECRVIDGLPRCITNTCTQGEKTDCQAKGATCEIGTKKIEGVDKNYTYCKPGSSSAAAPGGPAAAPAANPASAANRSTTSTAAAPAAASTTKTPWDKDADGDSKLISQVYAKAAQATSGSTDNSKDALDAARKAKAAYEAGFKKAYSDIFKADISKDPDALKDLNTQANYVAVHAYTAVEPAYKGKAWDPSNIKGAIDNLKSTGIIPQNADLSKITPPNTVPGTASAPTKKTIDPAVAVDCGSDIDGTKIPCYKMGVFASYDDLKATEAEASIATKRYEKSQEILTAAKGKVSDSILEAAQAKLNAAKDKAAACMKK